VDCGGWVLGGGFGMSRGVLEVMVDARDAAMDGKRYDLVTEMCVATATVERMAEALEKAREFGAGLPRSLGYEFTHLPAIDAALRAFKGESE
jgi:hypothetical protein